MGFVIEDICDAEFEALDFPLPQEAIEEMKASEEHGSVTDGKSQILDDIVNSDEALLASVDGKPLFVVGVNTDLWSEQYKAFVIWGFSSIHAKGYPKLMVTEGRKLIAELADSYGALINCVDRRYAQSQKWLEMIGFRKTGAVVFHDGVPFDEMLYCPEWQKEV